MKRRQFLFRSAQAMALLQPVLSLRTVSAQQAGNKRLVMWLQCNGYSRSSDIFPSQSGTNFTLPSVFQNLNDLKGDMVIVDGINVIDSGAKKPKANNHVCSVGKVFSAHDVIVIEDQDGLPGGPSLDHVLAQELKMKTTEILVNDKAYTKMRGNPFASGARQFKRAQVDPSVVWDLLFKGATPPGSTGDSEAKEQRLAYLSAKKSILDDLTGELTRFRRELAGDTERLKLDIHEDAIRRAELSIAEDIRATEEEEPAPQLCEFPNRPSSSNGNIPVRARAMMDLLFAALVCDRIQIGGVVWGWSGYRWNYSWVPGTNISNYHDVAHGNIRSEWLKGMAWDWEQIGALARRLKNTPDGESNMLDSTIVLGMGHFGNHHKIERIPAVIMGGRAGGLRLGRSIKLEKRENNDKLLTSIARYMGANISGIGNNKKCGPLSGL